MTCIVALKHNNKIYMGADSLGSNGSTMSKAVRLDEKVFVKDDMLFGFTTSFRMGQILRYVMTAPERPEGITDMAYLVAYWIPALIACFEDNGFRGYKEDDDEKSKVGGEFLLGYRGTLYHIEGDFQVGIPADQFSAAGCGQDLALGAVYAAKNAGVKAPEKIITMALEASEHFSAGCQGPFHILSI
jgi:ATP-dependent protease HslVU (ClpYQ) peptidase subunit